MLSFDDLAMVEGEHRAIYREAGADEDRPPSMASLCRLLTGRAPEFVRMPHRGHAGPHPRGGWLVRVHSALPPDVKRHVLGHELAHYWFDRIQLRDDGPKLEQLCDALGASLCAPTVAFARACRTVGHRVHVLAKAFEVPQELALLRIGEVTGRPVALLTKRAIVRGEPFGWPCASGLRAAVKSPPPNVHPILVGQNVGLMASRHAWPSAA